MQVDPIKPTLKAPEIQRLKLKYDEPLSSFAFKFNLRHYTEVCFSKSYPGASSSSTFVETYFADCMQAHTHGRAVQVDSIIPRVESVLGFSAWH